MGVEVTALFDLKTFSRITAQIMAAGVDRDAWLDVLHALSGTMGGIKIQLFGIDLANDTPLGMIGSGLATWQIKAYEQAFADKTRMLRNKRPDRTASGKAGNTASKVSTASKASTDDTGRHRGLNGEAVPPPDSDLWYRWLLPDRSEVGAGGPLLFDSNDRLFVMAGILPRGQAEKKR